MILIDIITFNTMIPLSILFWIICIFISFAITVTLFRWKVFKVKYLTILTENKYVNKYDKTHKATTTDTIDAILYIWVQ